MSSKTLKITVVAFVALSAAVLMYGTLMYFMSMYMAKATAESEMRAHRDARERELLTLTKLLESSADDRARLREFMVTDDRLTEPLALIERIAREQGLVATTQSVEIQKADNNHFEYLRVAVVVSGSYAGSKRFIELIETLPYKVAVDSVAFERRENGVWDTTAIFRITKERLP